MSELMIGFLAIGLMLVAIVVGMHIGVALIVTSFLSVWLLKSPEIAARFVGAAANDSIRDYLFGVVPLFVLMGMFVSVSGVGRDTFDVFQWLLRRLRGGLGLATPAEKTLPAGLAIGTPALITVSLDVESPFEIRAHVAWTMEGTATVTDAGLGLEFDEMTESEQMLVDLLTRLHQPASVTLAFFTDED